MSLQKEFTTVTKLSKTIAFILFILLPILAFLYGRQFEKNNKTNKNPTIEQPSPILQITSPPASDSQSEIPQPAHTGNNRISYPTEALPIVGADLYDIKYSLPTTWEAEINENSLMLSPKKSGGYLIIKVYDYPETRGRREFYCQTTSFCLEGITQFTDIRIGNISGYMATALDNSGGGSEYFGAKGSKFYIISSYIPPSPNDFENNYKNVLDSLLF